jgi:hypothetical protein
VARGGDGSSRMVHRRNRETQVSTYPKSVTFFRFQIEPSI